MSDAIRGRRLSDMSRADELCAADPFQATVRDALLQIESDADAMGWNTTNSTVYLALTNNADTVMAKMPMFTEMLHVISVQFCGGEVGEAIARLAHVVSQVPTAPQGVQDSLNSVLGHMIPDGWRLFGVGLMAEAWAVQVSTREEAMNHPRGIEHRPDARELRFAQLATVDDRFWTVIHQRDDEVLYQVTNPDEPSPNDGLIVDALTRMATALAAT